MLLKLNKFQADRAAGNTSSSLWERFRFFKKEKDRTTCLKNLKTWRKNLGQVAERSSRVAEKQKGVLILPVKDEVRVPSSLLRTLSNRLFSGLRKCWSCGCESPHEARFCIATCDGNGNKDPGETGIKFDFLVSHEETKWCEGTVHVKSIRYATVRY